MIEDVADVADDEEAFGNFQFQRVEQEYEIREGQLTAGGGWFDQYQTVRRTEKQLKAL